MRWSRACCCSPSCHRSTLTNFQVMTGWCSCGPNNDWCRLNKPAPIRPWRAVTDHFERIDGDLEMANDAAAAEIACALSLTRRAADRELGLANTLKHRLPNVAAALRTGRIDMRRANTIVRGTDHLDPQHAVTIADTILEAASELTTGQIHARLRKLCIETDPDDAKLRFTESHEDRHVSVQPTEAGTATLTVFGVSPERAHAATNRINQIAQSLKTAGELRTIDQLRADVLIDLLCGTETHGIGRKAVVDIRVDLTTLAQLQNHPGDLAGYGPVIADIARQVAETQQDQQWDITVTDEDGRPVLQSTTRRRPNRAQQRVVWFRRPTCTFKGCRMPARDSDIDHTRPYADGGPTHTDNLEPLCRHHHRIKHQHRWTYKRTKHGTIKWTTRLGLIYEIALPPP